jgi:hypothetical protein
MRAFHNSATFMLPLSTSALMGSSRSPFSTLKLSLFNQLPRDGAAFGLATSRPISTDSAVSRFARWFNFDFFRFSQSSLE